MSTEDRLGSGATVFAGQPPEGSSSTGRAPVSKTGGWGFKSLLPCVPYARVVPVAVRRTNVSPRQIEEKDIPSWR